jgi:D-glycero-alpha-D-manno-heptose-7-phosphate kinase
MLRDSMINAKMIRAKAPLRIGLAGGGTDLSPYSDQYGGAILNATVSYYASTTIEPRTDGKIVLHARDLEESITLASADKLEIDGKLDLVKGVYNRIVKDFAQEALSFTLTTHSDVPKGSGMGGSSTITVSMIGAFAEWLKLPLGEYDIAKLAYDIERIDLKMAGGKQDQYAATFGGFNFMEFYGDKVIVNPLRIREKYLNELEFNLLLYYTGTSRLSSTIIEKQAKGFSQSAHKSIEAAHKVKEQAVRMKEAILTGSLDEIGEILDFGWHYKKQMAAGISNPAIDEIYTAAMKSGATGGKISGAGGGGFMMFYCPNNTRYDVKEILEKFGGSVHKFSFVNHGVHSWTI